METLVLSENGFNEEIPHGLGNCSNLTLFSAVNANLVGSIPASLGRLEKLSTLYLSGNSLSGKIPSELGNCKSLKILQMNKNQLEEEIPSKLGMLSELQDLQLFTNHLTGEIPASVWDIPGLKYLLLYNNSLFGKLPLKMTELKQLKNISLFNNNFSGVIPQSLGVNCSLVQLDFTNNNFTGKIPPSLCFGKQLVLLNMGLNRLEGSIPADVVNCSTLHRLILKQNNLTGPLPEFGKNSKFVYMDLSENKIDGTIPSSLANWNNLTYLNLAMNTLKGVIPKELENLVNLEALILSHNRLVGPLPAQLSLCTKLQLFDFGFNSLNGSVPSSLRSWTGLSALILSDNHFTGGIPPFLSTLEKLSELQIGGNLLGGEILSSVGSLQNLLYALNLSSNKLMGQIPVELRKLIKLQRLDISHNNLTGSLAPLGEMNSLVDVNISYNLFSGPIPESLMEMLTSSSSSFSDNPSLCVNCIPSGSTTCSGNSTFKTCANQSTGEKGLSITKIVIIALGSSLFVVFTVLGAPYLIHLVRKRMKEIQISAHERVSVLLNKVMEVTENLNDRHIIGRGAHGTVYKASLDPDKTFAIKKLVFTGHKGGNQSMVREIETVGKIRHRNLVRFEDFWLREDHGLILYRYMPNGSLHDVLHEMNPKSTLEWSVRYNIAIGTGHGLSYLHYDCDPVIVHRDINPKNILLDSEMEPHISDFGIARLLDQSTSVPTISVVGTLGYIAPENAYTTTNSKESDVYSYGVVLLELITRKKALDPSFVSETDIVGWVQAVWDRTEEITMIVDSDLMDKVLDSNIMEQVIGVMLVALNCTDKVASKRPTMRDVVKQLSDLKTSKSSKSS